MSDYLRKPLDSAFDPLSWFASNLGLMSGAGIAVGIIFGVGGAPGWFLAVAFAAAIVHLFVAGLVWARRQSTTVETAVAVSLATGGSLAVVLWLCSPGGLPGQWGFLASGSFRCWRQCTGSLLVAVLSPRLLIRHSAV